MNTFAVFILGVLVGWIAEWIIDWIYWRRRKDRYPTEGTDLRDRLAATEARNVELERQLANTRLGETGLETSGVRIAADALEVPAVPAVPHFEERAAELEVTPEPIQANLLESESENILESRQRSATMDVSEEAGALAGEAEPPAPDDLIIINGIGPVIARKLNQAGIYTFDQLAELTPLRLRELVGDVISRLANEEDIIEQARVLAARKHEHGV